MKNFTCKIQPSVLLILISISLTHTSSSFADILSWDANSEEDLAGYNLYYDTSSPNNGSVVDVGNVTDYSLNNLNLNEDEIYYLVLTSYDTSGNESGFSEEVSFFPDDEIPDYEDNCPNYYNPNQEDTYPSSGNGIGDACDCEGDFDCDGDVDGWDGMLFQADYGRSPIQNPCENVNSCNGDFNCDGDVDGDDADVFKEDLGRNFYNHPCPPCEMSDWCNYQ